MNMEKKKIVTIRFVSYETGLIKDEYKHTYDFNFRFKKSSEFLHAFLDDFIQKIQDPRYEDDLCLEFMVVPPLQEGKLLF